MTPGERRAAALEALKGAHPRPSRVRECHYKAKLPWIAGHHPPGRMWSQCKKKKAYSRRFAEKVIANVLATRGTRLRMYLCQYCGRYHLTKKLKPGD